jgi:phosphoribosyl 1,2-cyclic phosphate phosphodiesterase
MKNLTVTFLGTGTSTGVPENGCSCKTCQSTDQKDNRLRSSIWLKTEQTSILIDTTPDLRQQCLREKIPDIDAVFYTHLHADHFFGLDDLRRYNWIHKKAIDLFIPFFMEPQFKQVFGYTVDAPPSLASLPIMNLNTIDRQPITYHDLTLTPLPILHGGEEIRGYLIKYNQNRIAYLTDCKTVPEETMKQLQNVDYLIVGAIWQGKHKHHKHFDLEEAQNLGKQINAKQLLFTHISHHMGKHQPLAQQLPPHCTPAYDGMKLIFD